jgi:SWI/SNF-related matrix-associated actin-dependent regulator 1 of chromatin subfamily A
MKTPKKLKPFQLEAVIFLTGKRKNVLLADKMGLGKTISTIGALNRLLPNKVLIVCPAAIKHQWKQVIEEEATIWPTEVEIVSGRDYKLKGKNIVIVNYDVLPSFQLLRQLTNVKWDVGVYDEVHYCKSMDAKRTKAVFGTVGLVHSCERNILLTGTPILNRPVELYPMLKALAPDVLGKEDTLEKFGVKFCKGWWDGYQLNTEGSSNEDELGRRLKNGFMLRRTEKEVELQLPAKRHQVFLIEGEDGDIRQLAELTTADFKKQRFTTDEHIATIRRELAVKKVKKSMELIKDIVNQVDKLVIFAYHKEVIQILKDELKEKCIKIDGSCSTIERKAALLTFKAFSEVKVLVGQITAAGQGLDGCQDVCNNVLFVETAWSPAEIDQAVARCYRMGQTKSVLVQFIVWAKSVEEHMIRKCIDKAETITKIIGE